MEEEDIKLKIEKLRAKRNERSLMNERESKQIYNEKSSNKNDGIKGVLTFQAILAIVIAIVYVITLTFSPLVAKSAITLIKDKTNNDFSFKDTVYTAVGNAVTYLNQIKPFKNEDVYSSTPSSVNTDISSEKAESSASKNISSNGKGGIFNPVSNNILPKNVTFAPIIFTGSITFPVKGGGKITSDFGFRNSPIYNKKEFHNGIDIAAPKGTDILAAFDGTISKSTAGKSLGNYIIIDHGNEFYTTYGHCSKLIAKEGEQIREGEVIAKVGNTGDSTGNHLHFAMQMDNLYFDPSYIFPTYLNDSI